MLYSMPEFALMPALSSTVFAFAINGAGSRLNEAVTRLAEPSRVPAQTMHEEARFGALKFA